MEEANRNFHQHEPLILVPGSHYGHARAMQPVGSEANSGLQVQDRDSDWMERRIVGMAKTLL